MRLRLRGLSSPEDRFEAWIAQRHQERVLEGSATPPGDAFARHNKAVHPGEAFPTDSGIGHELRARAGR